MTLVNENEQLNTDKTSFIDNVTDTKLGNFNININYKNVKGNYDKLSYEIQKISQEDIADGWTQKLPTKYKKQQLHHFNITLAELPPHLWSKPHIKNYLYSNNVDLDENNCFTIKDNIYSYSINKCQHYEKIYNLYNELHKPNKNINSIKELYLYCIDNKINGWLINATEKYIETYL
jgi:hypothetical protein